jgi:hypothetical protein
MEEGVSLPRIEDTPAQLDAAAAAADERGDTWLARVLRACARDRRAFHDRRADYRGPSRRGADRPPMLIAYPLQHERPAAGRLHLRKWAAVVAGYLFVTVCDDGPMDPERPRPFYPDEPHPRVCRACLTGREKALRAQRAEDDRYFSLLRKTP